MESTRALEHLGDGEDTLVVTKLDRLGRSVANLEAIAKTLVERDLIVGRTHDGLAAARARGRVGGRRPKLTPTQVKVARTMHDARQHTVAQIAESFGVTRSTIYRHLDPDTAADSRKPNMP